MAKLGYTPHPGKSRKPAKKWSRGTYDPLPKGEYRLKVLDAEMKPPQKGGPDYLSLTLQVIEGDFKKRLVWDVLVLNHANDEPRQIAREKLEALAVSAGHDVSEVTDSDQLIGWTCTAYVTIKEQKGFSPKNKISNYVDSDAEDDADSDEMQASKGRKLFQDPAPANTNGRNGSDRAVGQRTGRNKLDDDIGI